MLAAPVTRPVYRALHRQMTWAGIPRYQAIVALLAGFLTASHYHTKLGGVLMVLVVWALAFAMRGDPQLPRLFWLSIALRRTTRYDSAKHEPIEVRLC
jgi:type IV secretory pathway TrbD component